MEYGLEDVSSTQVVSIVYTAASYTLTLSSFAVFQPAVVFLLLYLVNPNVLGVSDPL